MGLVMSPGSVMAQLDSMNSQLEKAMENAGEGLRVMAQLAETKDELSGKSYDSMREYYELVHIPVLQGIILYAEALTQENNAYKGCIAGNLSGIGYVDEDALKEHRDAIKRQIDAVYGLMSRYKGSFSDYLSALERALELVEKKLNQIDSFMDSAAGLYQGMDSYRSLLHRGIVCLRGNHFNRNTRSYEIDGIAKDWIEDIKELQFTRCIQHQFGFDERTLGIMWDLYEKMQIQYPDVSQMELDWYFARALSQMGGYNEKSVDILKMTYETGAWRKGAGWVYECGKDSAENINIERAYFVDDLGLSEKDYRYLRGMIRLQHFMTSDPENYSYNAVENLKNNDKEKEKFLAWKGNMEKIKAVILTDDEYMQIYDDLYNQFKERGDFSHMMYTIAANLIDEEHGVENRWDNIGAPNLSWESAEERQKITGWLGDAVYEGEENQVSFGKDDYIADLDADNISKRVRRGSTLMESMNGYYQRIADKTDDEAEPYRTIEFLQNNGYSNIEADIMEIIGVADKDSNGEKDANDLANNETYRGTYEFLLKLQKYAEEAE